MPPKEAIASSSSNLWWFQPILEDCDYVIFLCKKTYACRWFLSQSRATVIMLKITSDEIQLDEICCQVLETTRLSKADFITWHIIEPSIRFCFIGERNAEVTTFACIGDLHHMSNPISHARCVLSAYSYDYILLTHSQYSHFFEDGNIYITGQNILSFPVCSNILRSGRNTSTQTIPDSTNKYRPVLMGSNLTSVTHPLRKLVTSIARRSRLIEINNERLAFNAWINKVAEANAVLTCSLNGSYSLQTLAPLANETLLITDKLTNHNQIGARLVHGNNCLIYEHPREINGILEMCQNRSIYDSITQRGKQLFLSLQKEENTAREELSKRKTHVFLNQKYPIKYNIPDTLVELMEILQELHRISIRMNVIISEDFTMFKSLQKNIQGLLPRMMLQPLDRPSFAEYTALFGNTSSCNVYLYVLIKPIIDQEAPNELSTNSPIIALKLIEATHWGEVLCENGFYWLESITGMTTWKQSNKNFCISPATKFN